MEPLFQNVAPVSVPENGTSFGVRKWNQFSQVVLPKGTLPPGLAEVRTMSFGRPLHFLARKLVPDSGTRIGATFVYNFHFFGKTV